MSSSAGTRSSVEGPPALVYQTQLGAAHAQDSSTPLQLTITLGHGVLPPGAGAVDVAVEAAIRRFDGAELEVWDDDTESMQGLRLPAACVTSAMQGRTLIVEVSSTSGERPGAADASVGCDLTT